MDTKELLAQLKKHWFWICCGLIAVAPIVIWYVACSNLQKETEERISKIDSSWSSGQQVTSVQNHPNPTSHQGTDALIRLSSQEVYEAWLEQVNHQQDVLVWPQELGADFIDQVDDKWPIERISFPPDPKDEIGIKYLERYRNYVDILLPKLARTAGAAWHTDENATEAVVEWNPSNQKILQSNHFSWESASGAPSTLEMLYAQETLWALTELMHIVRRTNGDAEARYQAAIKQIDFIDLSSGTAVTRAGSVARLGGAAGGAAGGAMDGGMPSGMPSGMPGGDVPGGDSAYGGAGFVPGADSSGGGAPQASGIGGVPGGGGGAPLVATNDPADYRYVDPRDFKPLTGADIRNALTSDKPESAFLVVAKRMPIRMRVRMDQRKLNRLLAEFGNADLPVEIRQVRINRPPGPKPGSSSAGGGGAGGMGMAMGGPDGPPGMGASGGMDGGGGIPGMPGGSDAGGGMPGMGGIGAMPGMGGSSPQRALSDSSPYDVDVELWGLIYIYNPVDMDKLGIEKSGEEAAAEAESATEESDAPPQPEQPGQPVAQGPGADAPAAN